jgi:hypothetical protein
MDTKEQTTREPLLSDSDIEKEVNPEDPNNYSTREYYETIGCKWVRDFYEAKITSGELIHLKGSDGTYRGDLRELQNRCKVLVMGIIDTIPAEELTVMAKEIEAKITKP